jgi:DNA polymerase III delta prime subunit
MRMRRNDQGGTESGRTSLSWIVALAAILAVAAIAVLELWPAPPAWLLPTRQRTVGVLHWVKTNWLSTAAIGTMTAVAGALTPFLIRWLDRRRPVQPPGVRPDALQRAVMLRRVHYKWITGVLEPSLARAARLVLDLERRPDLLDLGIRVIRRRGRPPEPLPPGTPISETFDNVGGGLLIVGPPGSGKTTALLQLCDELLDRAKRDASQPIPVVVNLASWAHHRPPLGAWLVDELAGSYQIPRAIATQWIEQDALVLLLDGLDEVTEAHRTACAKAVNTWRLDHGLVPMVVCSRTQELQALTESLRLEEAVELQPPSDAEVDRYLTFLEATGTPIGDVRAALVSDQDLRQLLRSPLLLHVVALAFHGGPASALSVPGTLRQRQAWLWEAYVARMLEQRPLDPGCGYTEEQALDWLAWLARTLRDRDQTELHLDRLAPEWLLPAHQRPARVATGLVGGLIAGLVFGPAFGLVAQAFALTFTLPTAVTVGLIAGLIFGLIGGLVFGLARRPTASLGQTNQPFWSWPTPQAPLSRPPTHQWRQERMGPNGAMEASRYNAPVVTAFGLVGGLSAGLSGGLLFGPTLGLLATLAAGLGCAVTVGLVLGLSGELLFEQTEQLRWSWSNLCTGLPRALVGGLTGGLFFGICFALLFNASAGLTFGLVFGLAVALAGGLSAGLVSGLREERFLPNEGIRRSAKYALVAGLSAGLVGGVAGGLAAGRLAGPASGMSAGLGFGLVFTLTVAMVFGGAACLQHFIVRAWLAREGIAPWRYGPFLEAMAQRLLLRRGGNAYLFAHRFLRDHLADPNPVRIQAAV